MKLFPVPPFIHPFSFGDEPINFGDMTIVNCAVIKGDLPIQISWTLNGKPTSVIDGINIIKIKPRVSQLSIDNVQEYHSGEYVCTANNEAKRESHKTTLNVNGNNVHNLAYSVLVQSPTLTYQQCFNTTVSKQLII